jgi:hypothetical protein
MTNLFPNWLSDFILSVETENEDGLFHSKEHDKEDLKFIDSPGGRIGSHISVFNKKYEITDLNIYTDMIKDSPKLDKYFFHLMLIVKEIKE